MFVSWTFLDGVLRACAATQLLVESLSWWWTVSRDVVQTGALASVRVENQGLFAFLHKMADTAALLEAEVLFQWAEAEFALVVVRCHWWLWGREWIKNYIITSSRKPMHCTSIHIIGINLSPFVSLPIYIYMYSVLQCKPLKYDFISFTSFVLYVNSLSLVHFWTGLAWHPSIVCTALKCLSNALCRQGGLCVLLCKISM